MARDHARVALSVWADDDWRDLSPAAQHLYFVLLTQPTLSYAGVADWRPARLRALASPWRRDGFDRAASELARRLYVVVDEDTEEVLIRSFVRHDGLMKQRNMAVSMVRAYEAIASKGIRAVFVHELARLRESDPGLAGWVSCEHVLDNRSIDPAEYPTGYPSNDTDVDPSTDPSVEGQSGGGPSPSVEGCPTPTPSPTPTPHSLLLAPAAQEPAKARRRATRIPNNFEPSPAVRADMAAKRPDVDLELETEKFRDFWAAKPGKDGTKLDWDATWRNWIRNSRQSPQSQQKPRAGNGYDPSDWLRPEQPSFVDAEVVHLREIGR